MKIYAPVESFEGWRNGVRFTRGVGETNNLKLIEWFKAHGYKVSNDESQFGQTSKNDQIRKTKDQIKRPTFDGMTPLELREWMKNNGFSRQIKGIRNKEKLLEILERGE